MARWRQDAKTGKLVPIGAATRAASRCAIHGNIEPFVSVVDGTTISDRKQLREHNERNGVVNAAEFSDEFYAKKAKERKDVLQGKKSRAETLKCKQEIYETWIAAERKAGY